MITLEYEKAIRHFEIHNRTIFCMGFYGLLDHSISCLYFNHRANSQISGMAY